MRQKYLVAQGYTFTHSNVLNGFTKSRVATKLGGAEDQQRRDSVKVGER